MVRNQMNDPRQRGRKRPQNTLEGNVGYEAAEEYVEENGGITVRTMKRAGKLMWVAIIFLLLTVLSVLGYMFMYNSSIVNAERSCWITEQRVEQLAQLYVSENGFSSLPAYVEDIPGYENVIKECPDGGAYTWNPITGEFSCSEHSHWPAGFNQAQSINTGTTTVMKEVS